MPAGGERDTVIYPIVVIAGSAGSLGPLQGLMAALPHPCRAAVFVTMHIGAQESQLPVLLARFSGLPASFPQDRAMIRPGHIYVAPPDRHMTIEAQTIRLDSGVKVHHTRPAADPLFLSAAPFGERVIGIVLSGADGDAAEGLRAIKQRGGTALVQHPDEAQHPSMPRAAIAADHPDACLRIEALAERLRAFCA